MSRPKRKRRFWTASEDALMRRFYPHTPTTRLAARLRRTVQSVYQRADGLGLFKTAEYMAGPHACRLRRGDNIGAPYRFPKGHVPANKGLCRPGWSPGRMRETQFKKGNRPQTWKPIGTEVLDDDGYLKRKVSDDQTPSRRNWVYVHVQAWTEKHGPVPADHAVCFKDGNKKNVAIGNLELRSRKQLMARNTVHNLPPEIVQVVQLNGALNRQIRKREKENGQKQNDGPAGPSVRHTRVAA
jgi:hypothetical protein